MWIGRRIDPLRDACFPGPAVAGSGSGYEGGAAGPPATRREDGPPYNPAVPILRIPDALGRYTGGSVEVEVEGATVGEALEEAFRRHPDLRLRVVDDAGFVRSHLAVFCNEEQLRREEAAGVPLVAGDIVTFLVAVGGGRG